MAFNDLLKSTWPWNQKKVAHLFVLAVLIFSYRYQLFEASSIYTKIQKDLSPKYTMNIFGYIKTKHKKHIDACVKERPQTLLVPSEEICKRILYNKHI